MPVFILLAIENMFVNGLLVCVVCAFFREFFIATSTIGTKPPVRNDHSDSQQGLTWFFAQAEYTTTVASRILCKCQLSAREAPSGTPAIQRRHHCHSEIKNALSADSARAAFTQLRIRKRAHLSSSAYPCLLDGRTLVHPPPSSFCAQYDASKISRKVSKFCFTQFTYQELKIGLFF